ARIVGGRDLAALLESKSALEVEPRVIEIARSLEKRRSREKESSLDPRHDARIADRHARERRSRLRSPAGRERRSRRAQNERGVREEAPPRQVARGRVLEKPRRGSEPVAPSELARRDEDESERIVRPTESRGDRRQESKPLGWRAVERGRT